MRCSTMSPAIAAVLARVEARVKAVVMYAS